MHRTTATAHDFWRLAEQAQAKGVRLYEEPVSGDTFATSASNPRILYRVTAHSCTCKGFVAWQRCMHHALLLAELGWLPELPDPDGDPEPDPTPAAPPSSQPAPWEEPEVLASAAPAAPAPAAPANVVAFPSSAGRAAAMADSVEESIERLARQLAEGHTAGFKELLAFMARFHRYSARNCLLILQQRPDATLVAGMRRWNELGRKVRAGEKAIWIWAPITKRAEDPATGLPVEEVVGFRPAPVWDAGQLADLDANPLPTAGPSLPDDAAELYALVKGRVEAAGIFVQERPLPTGVEGLSKGGVVVVEERLGSRERLFVLLHELAHELAHHGADRDKTTRQQRELEAEAVAFVAAAALGFELTGSRDYLLGYKVTPEELRSALGSVQGIARKALAIVAPDQGMPAGQPLAA